jgi:hypothetical protein
MLRRLVPLLLPVALVAGGCASDDPGTGGEGSTTTTEADAAGSSTAPSTTAALEPLGDQAAPASINGLTVDGDTLWIASIEADEVLQVRIDDGAILQRFPTDGAAPDDVAVAPDGSVWVTGFGNGDVGRIADGTYEVATTIASGINPIDVADDGTVLIGTFGPDGDLYRLDPDDLGDEAPGGAWEPIATELPDINGFELLPDGRLFAPAGGLGGPGAAIAIDLETGAYETLAAGLPAVAAAAVDAEGIPHLLANITGEVLRVDVEAGRADLVQTVAGGPFDNLAFGDDGTLYLSSFTSPSVVEVPADDGPVRTIAIGS